MQTQLTIPAIAEGAVTARRILRVGTADHALAQSAVKNVPLIAVAYFDAATGNHLTAVTAGVAKVQAGAAVTRGARITADADGRGVTAAAGENYVGVALESAGAADVLIDVLVSPGILES
jgi:predicted RecA/RadA family phage recombinase